MQRQIKACTHCRQHKVKCDAAKCFPKPCTRCMKFNLECIVDQNFKPRKGGQVEILREHLAKIQQQIQHISGGMTTIIGLNDGVNSSLSTPMIAQVSTTANQDPLGIPATASTGVFETDPQGLRIPNDIQRRYSDPQASVRSSLPAGIPPPAKRSKMDTVTTMNEIDNDLDTVKVIEASVAERMKAGGRLEPIKGPYKLESISLDEVLANRLHDYFMLQCAPYMPMFESSAAGELYARSEFLFWTVMTTAALTEPSADLYLTFVGPVKRLAATKCLQATTRSSSVVQALLVLCTWPLPSEKVLEDMSPRYSSLAYSMGLQLGIHRGKFIYEFSRNQQLMPNAVKWRTRTWVQTYITQQMISASTGIPSSMPVDFIIDHALHDDKNPLPPRTSALLKIYIFYSKLASIMGSSINTQDGLMEPNSRCSALDLLRTDLYTLFPPKSNYDDPVIEISFLYARLILDSFAFLPETPMINQSGFLVDAFQASTRVVTIVRQLVGNRKIIEFPALIRNPCSMAALILFRLQLMPHFPAQYVASARESIVTIHHMYRNVPTSWLNPRVSNDISRIAKLLESLNHVMITHPELLQSKRVMRHMRSHLTFSLFYEFLYIVHEAKRRNAEKAHTIESVTNGSQQHTADALSTSDILANTNDEHHLAAKANAFEDSSPEGYGDTPNGGGALRSLIHSGSARPHRDLNPLPLFNDINRDSYVSSTVISPNGTTMTKLTRANNSSTDLAALNGRNTNHDGVESHQSNGDENGASAINDFNIAATDAIKRELEDSRTKADARNRSDIAAGIEPARDSDHSKNNSLSMNMFTQDTLYAGFDINQQSAELGVDMNHLFSGLDWMNTEGDDFLGWMMPRNE